MAMDIKNCPDKVILMYKAVVSLVEEGRDINSLKVADITNRAGIGKGTAYEYFKSKEEIIANALLYDTAYKAAGIVEIVSKERNFKMLLYALFDWIIDELGTNYVFDFLLKIINNSSEISAEIKSAFLQESINFNEGLEFLYAIIQVGKNDGSIPNGAPDYDCLVALATQMMGFVFQLNNCFNLKNISMEYAKEFAYNSIIKSLN